MTGQFNAHMACCLLLQADEGFWAGDKTALGRIKGLITSETQMIESKGIDAIKMKNFVNLLTTSNEGWVVPAGKEERRFFVLDVHPRCASNHDYFQEMDAELAAGGREKLLYDLLHFDLSSVQLRQIPQTEALLEQKIRSLESMDSWWLSRLQDGTVTGGHVDWDATVFCDALYADFLRFCDESNRRKIEKPTFGINLLKLVPGLKKVRLPETEIEGKRKRPWGYCLPSLSDCRQGFENSMGQPISWPAPLGGDATDTIEAGVDDDVIPG